MRPLVKRIREGENYSTSIIGWKWNRSSGSFILAISLSAWGLWKIQLTRIIHSDAD